MRGWLELPETPFAGPVFEWIDGTAPDRLVEGLGREVVDVVCGLHADKRLASQLANMGDRIDTCAAAYFATYHDRFVEDLPFVRADRPPFIQPADLDWMAGEVDRLLDIVREAEAFQEPASSATHRDLWLNNLLVTPNGSWYLLDWDELALGDPVMDWAMLFGPTRANPGTVADVERGQVSLSPAGAERLAIYGRASLLDWVIPESNDNF